jgi:hypothetical protein
MIGPLVLPPTAIITTTIIIRMERTELLGMMTIQSTMTTTTTIISISTYSLNIRLVRCGRLLRNILSPI